LLGGMLAVSSQNNHSRAVPRVNEIDHFDAPTLGLQTTPAAQIEYFPFLFRESAKDSRMRLEGSDMEQARRDCSRQLAAILSGMFMPISRAVKVC
jgi:hypothetical protein